MKNLLIALALMMISKVSTAQTEKEAVKEIVTQFVKAADNQNAELVSELLHDDFRVVMNQLFGSKEVILMNKSTYVQLIREKKMGGEKRSVEFISVDVVNQNASVKVLLKGKTMVFESLIQLIKATDGNWLLINDLPFAVKI